MAATLKKPALPHSLTALLGLQEQNTFELISRVEAGLPFSAFEKLQRALGISVGELATILALSGGTLVRQKQSGVLSTTHSERLVRLARLTGAAIELFEGDREKAQHWLNAPRAALGGKTPLQMAGSELGAREVENLIGRLEDGVFM